MFIEQLARSNVDSPAFVAVEWDETLFNQVKRQRHGFRETIRTKWPQASKELLDILRDSLGFEGDSHLAQFPSAEILWLDAGRDETVESYSADRLLMYERFLGGVPLPSDSSEALSLLSNVAINRASHGTITPTSRDKTFAESIARRIAYQQGNWALIIVGALHASNHSGSMIDLLQTQGYDCQVTIL